jgi:DsrE/DsrF-like family
MAKNVVVLVTREGLGTVPVEDRSFGLEMFDKFLHSLETQKILPRTFCLYTDGVKLVCEGSPALLGLKLLQGMGVRMVVCRTCLERFHLLEKVAVGEIGGMSEITELLLEADSVVTI